MSEINVNSQYKLIYSKPLDAKSTPVTTIDDLYSIPRAQRYVGMTVTVLDWDGEGNSWDFWLVGGTGNNCWERKNSHIDCGEF